MKKYIIIFIFASLFFAGVSLATKGDTSVDTGSYAYTIMPVGADGTFRVASSGSAYGFVWTNAFATTTIFSKNIVATGTVDTVSGHVTTGSNASSTCTITFSTAFVNKPACVVSSETTSSIGYVVTPTTASLKISTVSSSAYKSNTLDFNCIGE